jgi:hypothetical protein
MMRTDERTRENLLMEASVTVAELLSMLKLVTETTRLLLWEQRAFGGSEAKCWRVAHYATQAAQAVVLKLEGEEP